MESTIPPPASDPKPAAVLSYSTVSSQPSTSLVKIVCWAALVYGALRVASDAIYWPFAFGLPGLAGIEPGSIASTVSAMGMVLGALGSLRFRAFGRRVLVFSSFALLLFPVLGAVITLFFNHRSFFDGHDFAIAEQFGSWAPAAVLPILVMIVMTRPSIRALFLVRRLSLADILIAAVIIAVPTSIMVRQAYAFDRSARQSELASTLQTVRSQIELFKIQHDDAPPLLITHGWSDMTGATTFGGQSWGPYMQHEVTNPMTETTTIAATPARGIAWVYDEATGDLHACDASGKQLPD